MNIEEIRIYCLKKAAVTECFPFDELSLVFKVANKMFALSALEKPSNIVLKCDPERALQLRETYSEIEGAYHMNKTMWNQIALQGNVPDKLIIELIDHSYDLVVSKLSKKDRISFGL
ncbi:MAG: MmcQ/YjbR family DNA-binding protein [Bacteroidales bacterium]|nr:MmcQ/YjbR family DNA-binding protein [Bacteroidales bacterium]MDD4217720.1 MmcQ/YjbR family DNA-binding protein [Bacteroidales bacterium]MDY0142116.1 MmcQ/YjbR family DNA-binding protein [Bacteroidales bacterium]